MPSSISSLLAFWALLHSSISAVATPVHNWPLTSGPRVNLGYATYEGTSLPNNVNQFLGMRYAAPVTGARRFRLPEDPNREDQVIKAQQHGPVCYGVTSQATPAPPLDYAEDCLYIDVYAPSHATVPGARRLPVMLWIPGGGFTLDFNSNYNGSGLIQASHEDVIVVTFNYRVGPYGFLASRELETEGNLNIGLHDQIAAMRWVQQHISHFGGDPEQVTLFGASIGAGSILLQYLAYGGEAPANLTSAWKAGIAESVFLPSVYTVDEMEFEYMHLLEATNCTSLECLRNLPIDVLQAANQAIPFPGQQDAALFGYGPVIDGGLIPDRPLNLLRQGKFAKDKPLIVGSSNTEGTIFTPQVNTTEGANRFLRAQFPGLTNDTLLKLNSLYSDIPETYPGVNVTESSLYYRTATIYGDSSFVCPAFTFAAVFEEAGVPVYSYLDRIVDPVELAAGYIVPHTWDLLAVWGPEYATNYVALPDANSYDSGKSNAAIVPVVQGFWTSFARTLGIPNTFRAKGSTIWTASKHGRFLNIETNATRMEQLSESMYEKCQFWAALGHETSH